VRSIEYSIFIMGVLCTGTAAPAWELWSDPNTERSADLDLAGKWTSLASHAPDDPILYPKQDSLSEFLRLRLGLDCQWQEGIDSRIAYEQRAHWYSDASAGTTGLLATGVPPPYRITQPDWQIDDHTDKSAYHHEIDRAFVNVQQPWGNIIVGRQAIGLGRGVLFSAVDMFSPFSPVEVDREWRRGVDAVRMEYELSDTSSAEVLGVFGQTWEQSALLTRIRGFVGNMDGELLLGKRANDTILGGVASATVADAEVHAELSIIDTPEEQTHDLAGNEHQALMAVLGTSYTFDIGNGLTVLGEYLYNGLGVKDATDINARLLDPAFRTRVLRGDMQTLSRQALALNLSYPLDPSVGASLLILQNPADGSGLAVPGLSWDINADARLLASLYLPWGEHSSAGQLQSTYGHTPLSLFIQVGIYR